MEVWGGIEPVNTTVRLPGLDCWVYAKPYAGSQAGGDVHYLSSCATGRIIRFLLADVSGHGAKVAQTAIMLRDLMRQYVNYLDQSKFVAAINEQFAEMASLGTFATAIVATYFAPTRHLTLCNAGHPSPLLYRRAENRWSLLKGTQSSLPLGIEKVTDYEQFSVQLQPGDLVMSYTDSLMESYKKEEDFVGMDGLVEIANGFADPKASAVIQHMLDKLSVMHPKNLRDDDVTALVFEAVAEEQYPTWKQKLGAAGRFFRSAVSHPLAMPRPDFKLANIGGAIIPALGRKWRGKEK
jgi:serine phosphatase RsbU (regulator of sigma subunit)